MSGDKTYSHFGDLGDTIAALCTIRQLGPGELVLYPGPGRVREPYHAAKVERVRDFFEAQEYITRVSFEEQPRGLILDHWRDKYRKGMNLADMVCSAFNVPHWPREQPWATVDKPYRVAPVVMHRSLRYHSRQKFPWKKIVRRWSSQAVFVGAEEEHKSFVWQFGFVPHYPTPTLLDLARVIAGADLMVGNQSTPAMLAEALKRPRWLERSLRHDNCHFERPTAWYGLVGPPDGIVKT